MAFPKFLKWSLSGLVAKSLFTDSTSSLFYKYPYNTPKRKKQSFPSSLCNIMSTVTPSPLRELMKEQNYNLDAFFTSLPTVMYRLLVGNLRCTLTSSKRWSAWLIHSLLSCALLHSQSLIFLLCPSCFSSCPHLFQCSSNYSPELHSGTQHSPVLCSPVAWVCCELKGKTVPCGSSRSLSFA